MRWCSLVAVVCTGLERRQWDGAPRARLEQVFYSFMRNHPEYLQVRLIARGDFGLERIRVDRDAHGIVVLPDSALQEKGRFSYVFDTLATAPGHICLSPIVINHETGRTRPKGCRSCAWAPVVDASGQTVGALVVDVELSRVFDRLERDLPEDYTVYLANEWGDFLVHPDPTQTFGFDRGRRVLMQDRFAVTRALFDSARANDTLNGLADPPRRRARCSRSCARRSGTTGQPLRRARDGASAGGCVVAGGHAWRADRPDGAGVELDGGDPRDPVRACDHAAAANARAATRVRRSGHRAVAGRACRQIGVLARCFDSMRVEIRTQVAMLRAKQLELTHLAGHDALTELPNRLLFMEHLDAAIRRAAALHEGLAVMFVDLDRFKQINDQHGHSAGDRTLVAVAKRLSLVLRGGDMVARLGGDEFIVLITDVRSPAVIGDVASRIQRVMDEELEFGDRRVAVGAVSASASFRLTVRRPRNCSSRPMRRCTRRRRPRSAFVRYQELVGNGSGAGSGTDEAAGRVASGGGR